MSYGFGSGFGSAGRRRPMVADGRGAQIRRERMDSDADRRIVELRRVKTLEEGRTKIPAPVLRSLAEIAGVVGSRPESPFYVLAVDETVSKIGKVIFGDEGYNRLKTNPTKQIGPHFDAYARDFAPWTLHVNHGRRGTVRGAFLPLETWQSYLETTDSLARSGTGEQSKRFVIGEKLFDSGADLFVAGLRDGTMTMLWHGDVNRPDLPPPGVHEYRTPNILLNGEPSEGMYTIYARQHTGNKFEGFTEV